MSIPGLGVAGRPAGARPTVVRSAGLLLAGGGGPDAAAHVRRWGGQPLLPLADLQQACADAAVVGAGGAEFPTLRKLQAVAGRRPGLVVVNAMEGEPASAKDHALLLVSPHLVLDGAAAVAHALGAREVVVRLADPALERALQPVLAQRPGLRCRISRGPDRFVAGEASAIARALRGGPALPDGRSRPPVAGWLRRPAFLSNVETFARIAVASRGIAESSALLTISGAVDRPGVVELPPHAVLDDALQLVGAVGDPAILVTGGWHGAWLPWTPGLAQVPLGRAAFRAAGGRWGAGVLIVLAADPAPRAVLSAVAAALAADSAGQCGPCREGLPALADALAVGADPAPFAAAVQGRGLCAHPTAAAAALLSGAAAVSAWERQGARR